MIVANDNIPQSSTVVGTGRVVPTNRMRSFMAKECMEPVGGYFLRVRGCDGEKYFVAAKVIRPESGYQTGAWIVEWHDSEKSAAEAVAPAWIYYQTHDYFGEAA